MKRIHVANLFGLLFVGLLFLLYFKNFAEISAVFDHEEVPSQPTSIPLRPIHDSAVEDEKQGPLLFPKTTKTYSLFELEQIGRVPDDADEKTWRLCEKTSWWGRRLDPDSFWSNRLVWLSWEAENEANRHGRRYPPIPSEESLFLDRTEKNVSNCTETWESRGRTYWSSEREHAYWHWYVLNCPWPPEKIQFGLEQAASEWKALQHRSVHRPAGMTIPPSSNEELLLGIASRFRSLGFPKEALSSAILEWEYVRCKRVERESIVRESDEFRRSLLLETFKQHLACPSSLVESEPTDEELRVTRGWRIDYLLRLRREGTDESYIEAYKEAWDLSEEDLREEEK